MITDPFGEIHRKSPIIDRVNNAFRGLNHGSMGHGLKVRNNPVVKARRDHITGCKAHGGRRSSI